MSSFDIDDDNSDDYAVPPGFNLKAEPEDAHDPITIVMGRPVEPNAVEIAVGKQVGVDFSDPYDGSEKMRCKQCMREIWIGPNQKAKMEEIEGAVVMCPEHAVRAMHDLGGTMEDVQNLGNVHPRGN
jgi:hypothetical protein